MDKRFTSKEEDQKRLELYNRGLNDAEIAVKCGVSATAILKWRRKNNLSSNGKPVSPIDFCKKERNFLYNSKQVKKFFREV